MLMDHAIATELLQQQMAIFTQAPPSLDVDTACYYLEWDDHSIDRDGSYSERDDYYMDTNGDYVGRDSTYRWRDDFYMIGHNLSMAKDGVDDTVNEENFRDVDY